MTVSSSASRNQYTATAGQTVFAYTFEIVSDDDIVVLKNGVTLTKTADYTVSGVGVDSGGNVTLTAVATAGDILTLYRDMPYERTTDYTNAGDFLAADVNNDFDRLWIATQQVNEEVNRSIKAPVTDPLTIDMTLPDKAGRVNKFLRFNSVTGNPEAVAIGDVFGSGTTNVYNFVGDGSTVAFTLGIDPGVENNTQVYIDGVYQQKNTYTVSGTTLTFSAAPPNLSTIEVMVIIPTGINTTAASSVSFVQSGSDDTRTVQAKLEESVSVKDFGAVGDGVTDDTAAIQAAFDNAEGTIIFPYGTYLATETLTMRNNQDVDLNGSTLNFSITGKKRCLITKNYCSVRNGKVANITTDPTVYGAEWQQPICIGFSNSLTDYVHDVVCENLEITSTSPEGNGIFVFGDSHNILVQNITFPDSSNIAEPIGGHWSVEPGGDETQGTGHPNNLIYRNIRIGSTSYSNMKGIFFSACRNVTLENVYVEDCQNGSVVEVYAGDHGFEFATDLTARSQGSVISIKNVSGKGKKGITLDMRDTLGPTQVWPSQITVENCRLLGRSASDTGGAGIVIGGIDNTLIQATSIDGFYRGVQFNSEVTHATFSDTKISNSYSTGVYATNSTGGAYLNFINCHLYNSNTSAGTGYDMSFGSSIEDITLDGNVFESTTNTYVVHVPSTNPAQRMRVINNHVKSSGGSCYVFGIATSTNVCELFNGNTFDPSVTANVRGGQEFVPFAVGGWKNTNIQTKYYQGTATPGSGSYQVGDIVYKTNPSVDGNNMILSHWICTVAGSPGTWSPQYVSTVSPAT